MTDAAGYVSLGQRLRDTAQELGDQTAVRSVRADRSFREITWRKLDARSDAVAAGLLEAGVKQNPATVVLITRDAVEHATYAYAAWKTGQTVLCLSPGLGSVEGRTILSRLDRTISFGAEMDWDTSERLSIAPEVIANRDVSEDAVADPMLLLASGGSTGIPKLIDAIGAGRYRPGDFLGGLGQALRRKPRVNTFVCTPLSHGAGAATAYMAMFEQCQLTSLEKFDADTALWAIKEFRIVQMTLVPTMMDRMVRSPLFSGEQLASVDAVVHTGNPVDPEVKRAWIDVIGGAKVLEVYGSTESVGHAVISGDEWLAHPGSVGRTVNCDVRILDAEGGDLPAGEIGELFVRPRVATIDPSKKYVGSDHRMKQIGDWVSFGDLASVDEQGYLYYAGRTDDLIITGGANVYPDEIEILVRRLPEVRDCLVVGRPDPDMGQAVHAVVSAEKSGTELTLDWLRRALDGQIAAYKMPRSLEQVDEIERSDAGKTRRAKHAQPPDSK